MVRYIWIIALIWGCASSEKKPQVQAPDPIHIEEGYQINYNLAWGDQRYQFILDMIQWEPDRVFNYTMTSLKRTVGKVTLTEAALDTARKEQNNFAGGDSKFGSNTLTVWISRQCFRELMTTDTTRFHPGRSFWEPQPSTFYKAGLKRYAYELNGRPQEIEVVIAKEKEGNSEFWILNDPKNPLIIRMDVGWVIWLKEINFS